MKSLESAIPQFYDLLDEEMNNLHFIFQIFREKFLINGFSEMRTTVMELQERYLNATNVHYSKIFEVHRVKERSKYSLQSDLAMSMSRFVACLDKNYGDLKLFQLGNIYRDRIDLKIGYRREFQQILSGAWGSENFYYDAELISINCQSLIKIEDISIEYIQISNYNIFNVINNDLSELIRFKGINQLKQSNIEESDKHGMIKLFEMDKVEVNYLHTVLELIKEIKVRDELMKVIEINKWLNILLPRVPVYFSLSNLEGSGHYSGLNYRIYGNINNSKILIGDGGRIDTLCNAFNSNKNIPAVCMGIGIQVVSQLLTSLNNNRVIILIQEIDLKQNFQTLFLLIEELRIKFNTLLVSKNKRYNVPQNQATILKKEMTML